MVNTMPLLSENAFSKTRKPGYSMVEILLVLGIIMVLVGGVFYLGKIAMDGAKRSSSERTLHAINFAIDSFHNHTSHYPTSLRDLTHKPQSGEITNWDGPYWKKPLEDAWGKKIFYKLTPEGKEHPYELYFKTPNGNSVSVWQN